jgi:hypothetical protein
MATPYQNFAEIVEGKEEELAYRRHGYIGRLMDEYAQRFPESQPLTRSKAVGFLRCYRMTHPDIPRIHGRNYKYHQAWVARHNSPTQAQAEEEETEAEEEAKGEAEAEGGDRIPTGYFSHTERR